MGSFENLEKIFKLLNLQIYLDLFKENKLDDEELQNGISLEDILGLEIVLGDARKIARKFEEFIQMPGKNSLNEWIKLNVGGTIFQTTRSTLIKEPNSMLAAMFDPNSNMEPGGKDSLGAYLIDRDPKYFGKILNFLRTGTLILDYYFNKEGVLKEAEFFGINSIIPQLKKYEKIVNEKDLEFKKFEFEKEKYNFVKKLRGREFLKKEEKNHEITDEIYYKICDANTRLLTSIIDEFNNF